MSSQTPGGARRILALVTGGQCAVLTGLAAFYAYELAIGEGSDTSGVVVSAVLIAGTAAALAALARGWWGDSEWPRTPTIVWNLLLLPVGWNLARADRPVGWLVLGVAVVATVMAFASREQEADRP